MRNSVEIEDIEAMRRREGIEDVELHEAIRGLAIGDFVHLTFLGGGKACAGETLRVRITRIEDDSLRGKLAARPAGAGLSNLRVGSPVRFTTAHIHSIPKRESGHEP